VTRQVGFHEDFGREEAVVGSSDRAFGLVMAAALSVIGGLGWWRGSGHAWWWLAGGAVFLAVALIRPAALAPVNRLWLKLGLLLYVVVNPVVMGVLFYGCVMPMGLVMRLLGKAPLRQRRDPQAETYWIERRPPGPAPDTMRHQF